jgi:hypothetical protein
MSGKQEATSSIDPRLVRGTQLSMSFPLSGLASSMLYIMVISTDSVKAILYL